MTSLGVPPDVGLLLVSFDSEVVDLAGGLDARQTVEGFGAAYLLRQPPVRYVLARRTGWTHPGFMAASRSLPRALPDLSPSSDPLGPFDDLIRLVKVLEAHVLTSDLPPRSSLLALRALSSHRNAVEGTLRVVGRQWDELMDDLRAIAAEVTSLAIDVRYGSGVSAAR